MFKLRNRTIVFKSESVLEKISSLKSKLIGHWSTDDFSYVFEMYKKSQVYSYSIDAEFEASKAQDKRARIIERLKSPASIMNPLRTTKS